MAISDITIEEILKEVFQPGYLKVLDESDRHKGHLESIKSGGGHYYVELSSDQFQGLSLMKRHRLVYSALQNFMGKDIHALTLKLYSPDENIPFDIKKAI